MTRHRSIGFVQAKFHQRKPPLDRCPDLENACWTPSQVGGNSGLPPPRPAFGDPWIWSARIIPRAAVHSIMRPCRISMCHLRDRFRSRDRLGESCAMGRSHLWSCLAREFMPRSLLNRIGLTKTCTHLSDDTTRERRMKDGTIFLELVSACSLIHQTSMISNRLLVSTSSAASSPPDSVRKIDRSIDGRPTLSTRSSILHHGRPPPETRSTSRTKSLYLCPSVRSLADAKLEYLQDAIFQI